MLPPSSEVVLEQMIPPIGEEVGLFYMDCEIYDAGPPVSINTGAKYQIVAFVGKNEKPCASAGDDYIIELEVTGNAFVPPLGTVEIVYRLFGPDGQIGSDQLTSTSDQYIRLAMCVSPYQIVCGEESQMDMWTCPDEKYGTEGRYFAIRNEGEANAYVDWAKYSDHYDHDRRCPDCDTNCCCTCIEDTADRDTRVLTATLYHDSGEHEGGDHNACSGMSGTELELMCEGIDFECCIAWKNDTEYFEFSCNNAFGASDGNTYKLRFVMSCSVPNDGCEGYLGKLSWVPGSDNYTGCRTSYAGETEWITPGGGGEYYSQTFPLSTDCDCVTNDDADAVNIVFGPFTLMNLPTGLFYPPPNDEVPTDVCYCCEEFYVVVTS